MVRYITNMAFSESPSTMIAIWELDCAVEHLRRLLIPVSMWTFESDCVDCNTVFPSRADELLLRQEDILVRLAKIMYGEPPFSSIRDY